MWTLPKLLACILHCYHTIGWCNFMQLDNCMNEYVCSVLNKVLTKVAAPHYSYVCKLTPRMFSKNLMLKCGRTIRATRVSWYHLFNRHLPPLNHSFTPLMAREWGRVQNNGNGAQPVSVYKGERHERLWKVKPNCPWGPPVAGCITFLTTPSFVFVN